MIYNVEKVGQRYIQVAIVALCLQIFQLGL